jgi:hypothetical protein
LLSFIEVDIHGKEIQYLSCGGGGKRRNKRKEKSATKSREGWQCEM